MLNFTAMQIEDVELKNLCLIEIQKLLFSSGRSLKEFPCMPYPEYEDVNLYDNRLLIDELTYDRGKMSNLHVNLKNSLNPE